MQQPESEGVTAHLPLAERWRRLRAAYRICNLASHHILGFTVKLALLLYFAFTLLFLALRYAILPNIDYYKGDIERLASRAVGNQVTIARIYASWDGLRPNLFLGDVMLRDPQGRAALSLPSVSATLGWSSLFTGVARFESLEIIRPTLDVRRDPAGKLSVAGIVLKSQAGGAPNDWVLRQSHILIRQGKINWTDQLRGAPELALDNVDLLLLNTWNHHRVALHATPPASLAQPLDVRADFTSPRFAGNRADVSLWKGELYADLRDTDLAGWKPYFDYPFQLTQGRGSVRAWLSLDHAKLAGFTADVALAAVSAKLGRDLPPLELASATGRLSAREQFPDGVEDGRPSFGAHGHSVTLDNFSVVTVDGLTLPPTTLSEMFTPASRGKPEKVVVSARAIDLATLAELAAQLPMQPSKRAMLDDFKPRGKLLDFSAEWEGAYPAISTYRVRGRVENLGLNAQPPRPAQPKTASTPAVAAMPAIPGFDRLTGTIDASDQGGALALDSTNLVLQMPHFFAEPAMPFDQLKMQARWSYPKADQLALQLDGLSFAQGKLHGSLAGKHLMPLTPGAGKFGVADLHGTLDGFQINRIDRFLPLQTPPHLRAWLVGALEDGTLEDATVRLRGELAQFPYRADTAAERARGEFHVAGRLAGAKLNYTPGRFGKDGKAPLWPQAEKIDGSIVFDRSRLEIKADTAQTGGVQLVGVKAVIPDLMTHDMQLEIDGGAAGPLQEFLKYVAASPVTDWIGHFTDDARTSNSAKLGLKLRMPLARLADTKVAGSLQLLSNDIVLFDDLPPLQAAIGKIDFTERAVALNGVGASFLGGPLALTGGTQKEGGIVIRMAGTASADGMRKTWPAPAMQRLVSHFSGAARFTGAIAVKDRKVEVTVDSTLGGLGLAFPAPLNKPAAAETLPLHFVLTGMPTGDPAIARDDIRITLGSAISARYLRQKSGKAPWNVVRGGIGVNVPAPEPDSGVMVNANMKSLNVDQWIALGSGIAGPAATAPAPDAASGPQGLAQYVVPDVMAARANELIVADRKLDNVVVGASHQKDTWQASIDSKQASGYVTWNEGPSGQGLGKVTARLATLIIPESAEAEVKDLLEGSRSATASVPALDIVAERFELFNKQLGRLELVASNEKALAGREWRINRLSLVNPDGDLKATGKWLTRDGKSNTSVNFTMDIADAGRLLDRFGFPGTLKRGKGKLSGDIAWMGLPYSLDIPSLSGQIEMKVESGQFLKQDPGAAKLLGVLSLQALPRLLKLDFHDVFSEGLAFDGISANAIIAKGVLKTDNLKMHGVAATVLMDGTADIAHETTNLHVVVIPEFNLGTGPLVYALAVNPVIGLGSFLAQLFLRAPMMKALTYQMKVEGPWKAPVITKLDRRTPLPAAAVKK